LEYSYTTEDFSSITEKLKIEKIRRTNLIDSEATDSKNTQTPGHTTQKVSPKRP
jgi:hypothetical protein